MLIQKLPDRRRGKKVLLPQPQNFPLLGVVRGVKVFANFFRLVAALRLPQPQRVCALAEDGHIVRHGGNGHIRKANRPLFVLAPYRPRVAEALPVVGQFCLKAVFYRLLKQSVFVSDAIAVQGQSKPRGRIEKARRKPTKPAVTKRRVLYFLKNAYIYTLLCKNIRRFLQNAQLQ